MNLKNDYSVVGSGHPIRDLEKGLKVAIELSRESGLVKKIINFYRTEVVFVSSPGKQLIISQWADQKEAKLIYKAAAKLGWGIQRIG